MDMFASVNSHHQQRGGEGGNTAWPRGSCPKIEEAGLQILGELTSRRGWRRCLWQRGGDVERREERRRFYKEGAAPLPIWLRCLDRDRVTQGGRGVEGGCVTGRLTRGGLWEARWQDSHALCHSEWGGERRGLGLHSVIWWLETCNVLSPENWKFPAEDLRIRQVPPVCISARGRGGTFQQRQYPIHWLLGQLSKVICLCPYSGEWEGKCHSAVRSLVEGGWSRFPPGKVPESPPCPLWPSSPVPRGIHCFVKFLESGLSPKMFQLTLLLPCVPEISLGNPACSPLLGEKQSTL